jgi:hypothetical protein
MGNDARPADWVYPVYTAPNDVMYDPTNGDAAHEWVKGETEVIDRITHRLWRCECGAWGYTIEPIPK